MRGHGGNALTHAQLSSGRAGGTVLRGGRRRLRADDDLQVGVEVALVDVNDAWVTDHVLSLDRKSVV